MLVVALEIAARMFEVLVFALLVIVVVLAFALLVIVLVLLAAFEIMLAA